MKLTHEASGVGVVRANLSVDLDQALLDNGCDFTTSKGILQAVTEEDGEGKGFAELMGTRGWAGSLHTDTKIVQLGKVAIQKYLERRT